jgi:hypothetical protein
MATGQTNNERNRKTIMEKGEKKTGERHEKMELVAIHK